MVPRGCVWKTPGDTRINYDNVTLAWCGTVFPLRKNENLLWLQYQEDVIVPSSGFLVKFGLCTYIHTIYFQENVNPRSSHHTFVKLTSDHTPVDHSRHGSVLHSCCVNGLVIPSHASSASSSNVIVFIHITSRDRVPVPHGCVHCNHAIKIVENKYYYIYLYN